MRPPSALLRLGDSPASTAHLKHEPLGGRSTNRLLVIGELAHRFLRLRLGLGLFDGRSDISLFGRVLRGLQLADQFSRFVRREPSAGLALIEPHRTTGITEIGMAEVAEQFEELFYLTTRCRWSRALSKCHDPVWLAERLVGRIRLVTGSDGT